MEFTRRRRFKNAIIRRRFPFRGLLARAYLRTIEQYRTLRGGSSELIVNDGPSLPPARLRVLVGGTADAEWFLESGKTHAAYLRELAAGAGKPIDRMGAILDLGCGCGRIARWFSDLEESRLHGCDYNEELVAWCRDNLAFMNVSRNQLRPPLPYPDRTFDFLYAYSVFTHLSIELATEWMAEIGRVTRPGALIWFTVHGAMYRERLAVADRNRFDNGEIVVWLPEIQGTNLCGSYWPPTAAERMLPSGFEMVTHLDPQSSPSVARELHLNQDAYLARRAQN
jgi:SAM-dependent methyltransferase